MKPVLSQISKTPNDLVNGNMSGNLVDHPAPKYSSDQQSKSTFTIEQERKMVNTRPNTQLKHHHKNCYGFVVPIKMQAKAYRQ